MSTRVSQRHEQERIDLCSPPSPHPPPAKRLRGEQQDMPRMKEIGAAAAADDIIDLSLDGPDSVERQQPAANQHLNNDPTSRRSLWGELAASEGSARRSHCVFENDLQLPQWRDARRRRSPYVPPSMPPMQYTAAAAAADTLTGVRTSSGLPADTWSFLHPRFRQSDDGATESAMPQPRSRRRHFQHAAPTGLSSSSPPPHTFSSSLPGSPPHLHWPTDEMYRFAPPHSRKDQEDAAIARRLQQEEEAAAARAARATRFREQQAAALQRRLDEEALERRMEQLQALEEATQGWSEDDDDEEAEADFWAGSRFGGQRGRRGGIGSGRRRFGLGSSGRGGRGQDRDFSGSTLADAMMNMLTESGSWSNMHLPRGREGPPFAGGAGTSRFGGGDLAGALGAMRAALQGMASGSRLPPNLLFSDRDFNENDYEALLALDEGIENRRGASKDDIETMPTVVLSTAVTDTAQDVRCPICLEDYVAGATLRCMPCGHQMHKDCLDAWLQQRAACPICQASAKGLQP